MSPAAKSIGARVRTYLAKQPPVARRELKRMRAAVRALAPGAVEIFSYGMPGFRMDGRPLVWYAGFKSHVSLFPLTAGMRRTNAAALRNYGTSTGTVRF